MWWVLWSALQVFVLHRLGLSWDLAVLDSSISSALLALACFAAITLYSFYQPGVQNRVYRFVFALGITVMYTVVFKWLMQSILFDNSHYHLFLEASMPIRFVIALLVLTFLTLLSWLLNAIKEQSERESRQTEAEQWAKEAELVKLQQQLQPHFLFNSLNSISALVGSKPNEARKMIQQLSDFLRGTLKKDEQQLVSLNDEIDHLQLYLDIEKLRFGERLSIELHSDSVAGVCKLPALILQPIVENAIKFGLYGTLGEITIYISAKNTASVLEIEVRNPFDKPTQQSAAGTGFGLSSVQRRLFLLYARQDLLSVHPGEKEFVTRIKIPQSQ